jgi:hypothetical protein
MELRLSAIINVNRNPCSGDSALAAMFWAAPLTD